MKLAAVGSRDFNNKELAYKELDKLENIDLVVSGAARGADTICVEWAKERGIPFKEFEANWKDMSEPCVTKYNTQGPYNALAGFKRNTVVVENCDVVIAFWDYKSPGTKDTINKAKQAGKEVIIIGI